MQIYLVKSLIGIFALDKSRKVVSVKTFPKNPSMIAEMLSENRPIELNRIKDELKGNNEFILDNKEMEDFVKQNLLKYAIQYKFVQNQIEFNQLLSQVNSELAKQKIKQTADRDTLIVNVNNAIEELDKSINVYIERLREIYSIHFPELDREVENHETYAKLVDKFGNRKNFTEEKLKRLADSSVGMEFTREDEEIAKLYANNLIKFFEMRNRLTKYLSDLLKELAPNFTAIAGDSIASKLIAKAGSIEKLSKMPSSTIQLLGSEKALFRFLKSRGRSKSPKHGIIFNHPLIQNAPPESQGKIARLLSAKLSIAARIDYYSKEDKSQEMKKDLEKKVKEALGDHYRI